MSLIVKLSELSSLLSAAAADKTQYFLHLSFSSTLELINGISSDLRKLLKRFNGTAIVGVVTNMWNNLKQPEKTYNDLKRPTTNKK